MIDTGTVVPQPWTGTSGGGTTNNNGGPLFSAASVSPFSPYLQVDTKPLILRMFGSVPGDECIVQMVDGSTPNEVFADFIVNGQTLKLDSDNTVIAIAVPGRYRLRHVGPGLGRITVFYYPAASMHEFLSVFMRQSAAAAAPVAIECDPDIPSQQVVEGGLSQAIPMRFYGRFDLSPPAHYLADPTVWVRVCGDVYVPGYRLMDIQG